MLFFVHDIVSMTLNSASTKWVNERQEEFDIMKKDKVKVLIKPQSSTELREEFLNRFGEKCEFIFPDMDGDISTAEVIIGEPDKEEILAASRLKWIQLTWAGADKYTKMQDFPEDVTLTNASGAFGKIISEYVIGSIIALYRSFPLYWANKQNHIWAENNTADTIYGKEVLILGTGDIGKNIAYRLQVFGTHTTGIKRNVDTSHLLEGFDRVYSITALDQVLPKADIVIGCLPDTPLTRGILTYERLNSMKQGTVLVNVGRGSLVCNEDMIRVLRQGRLKGVIMDVSETEPLPAESPLWDMKNVIITPHIAGPSFGGNAGVQNMIWKICMENLERYVHGKSLENIVQIEKGY